MSSALRIQIQLTHVDPMEGRPLFDNHARQYVPIFEGSFDNILFASQRIRSDEQSVVFGFGYCFLEVFVRTFLQYNFGIALENEGDIWERKD